MARLRSSWWLAPLVLLAIVAAGVFFLWRAASPSAEEQARSILEAQLRDPVSLQIRNVRRVADGGLCGEMNARNAFGGYVGFRQFHIVGNFVAVEGEGDLPGVIAQQCEAG